MWGQANRGEQVYVCNAMIERKRLQGGAMLASGGHAQARLSEVAI